MRPARNQREFVVGCLSSMDAGQEPAGDCCETQDKSTNEQLSGSHDSLPGLEDITATRAGGSINEERTVNAYREQYDRNPL
jgi:hypothetical protein